MNISGIRPKQEFYAGVEKQELVTMRLTSPLGAISLVAGNSSAIVLPVRLKEEQKAA